MAIRIPIIFMAAVLSAVFFTACQETGTRVVDREYILFQDTLSVHPVLNDDNYSFTVPVSSTVSCSYDRTIAVEIVDEGSNAVEGRDYVLGSNTITIPAGKYSADVVVYPQYDRFNDEDTLSFNLKLVMPEQLTWSLYGDETKVSMYKVCPFSRDIFTGWCVVTSMFLYEYPGLTNVSQSYQRLIKTRPDPSDENAVILEDWLFDGYDVRICFDNSDPANPRVTMPDDQVISDELSVFGQANGDNRILGMDSPAYVSYFNSCQSFVSLWLRAYVYDLSTLVGYVGDFYNVMEWVSDEEADRLQKEEGM